jgi:hypothetical protein
MSDLKQLAQLYCALKVTQASPQLLLAAWAMLLVNHSKATIMHVSLSTRGPNALSASLAPCQCAAVLSLHAEVASSCCHAAGLLSHVGV